MKKIKKVGILPVDSLLESPKVASIAHLTEPTLCLYLQVDAAKPFLHDCINKILVTSSYAYKI